MMKNKLNKILATIPVFATMVTPMSVFAATGYQTSSENVTYSNAITQDAANNVVNVTVAQTSTFSVSIPKNISLSGASGETNEANYSIAVTGNIASDEVVKVTPSSSFQMTDSKGVKKALTATVKQPVTKFVNTEVKPIKYSSATDTNALGTNASGNVSVANLSAGSWAGTFNFDIKLETVTF